MSNIYGTDIKDSFSFSNGDIDIVSGIENLEQSILNILNTDLGFYDWCYTNYGSNLSKIYGRKNDNNSLEYLRIEIEHAVIKNPRINNVSVNCTKEDPITVNAELEILPINSEEIVTINLVINDDYKVQINDRSGEDGTNR